MRSDDLQPAITSYSPALPSTSTTSLRENNPPGQAVSDSGLLQSVGRHSAWVTAAFGGQCQISAAMCLHVSVLAGRSSAGCGLCWRTSEHRFRDHPVIRVGSTYQQPPVTWRLFRLYTSRIGVR